MRDSTFVLAIIIALLLMFLALIYPVRADNGPGRSVFNGTWVITYIDCQGKVRVFEGCTIEDLDGNQITFKTESRIVMVLPIVTGCSSVGMERER